MSRLLLLPNGNFAGAAVIRQSSGALSGAGAVGETCITLTVTVELLMKPDASSEEYADLLRPVLIEKMQSAVQKAGIDAIVAVGHERLTAWKIDVIDQRNT